MELLIIDRNNKTRVFNPNEITNRIINVIKGDLETIKLKDLKIPYGNILKDTISQLYEGMYTHEIDTIMAKIAYSFCIYNIKNLELSSRLIVSNHIKNINYFNSLMNINKPEKDINILNVYENDIIKCYASLFSSHKVSLLSINFISFILSQSNNLQKILNGYSNYLIDYNGFNLLKTNYLLKILQNNFNKNNFINKMDYYFNFKIQDISNLFYDNSIILETPELLILRVCIALSIPKLNIINTCNKNDKNYEKNIKQLLQKYCKYYDEMDTTLILKNIEDKFSDMSKYFYTQATPTLFNSGTINQQFASCFLIGLNDDIDSIGDYYKNCMKISKNSGGIGSHLSNIRCEKSYIHGTGGTSNGICKLLRVSNEISLYIDQGGNKRAGSNAIYMELWHGDIINFLNLKSVNNIGDKAPDLFYGCWINDEFNRVMQKEYKLKSQGKDYKLWYLIDPAQCEVQLSDVYDETFNCDWVENPEIGKYSFTYYYRKYIKENKYVDRVSAIDIWQLICKITSETGVPYKCFKDAANRKTNQSNLGVIKSSNLCTEIYEYSDANETAVCNLSSICLPKFITKYKPNTAHLYPFTDGFKLYGTNKILYFDFEKLRNITKQITENLNNTIDKSDYPTKESKRSNIKNRPIGIGVQGLADVFSKLCLPWDSELSYKLDFYIFENIYYSAIEKSNELCIKAYETFNNSYMSKGIFQQDLWVNEFLQREDKLQYNPIKYNYSCDWDLLRNKVKNTGIINSLFIAPMPTASTSTLMNNSPSIEPYNGLIYKRVNKYGESILYNKQLIKLLSKNNLWNVDLVNEILSSRTGGIQDTTLPIEIKNIYKTAFELSPKIIIDHALIRSPFVDQGISLNLFIENPTTDNLTKSYMYAWKRGIKTGSYYTRRLAPVDAKKIKIINYENTEKTKSNIICSGDECVMCSS